MLQSMINDLKAVPLLSYLSLVPVTVLCFLLQPFDVHPYDSAVFFITVGIAANVAIYSNKKTAMKKEDVKARFFLIFPLFLAANIIMFITVFLLEQSPRFFHLQNVLIAFAASIIVIAIYYAIYQYSRSVAYFIIFVPFTVVLITGIPETIRTPFKSWSHWPIYPAAMIVAFGCFWMMLKRNESVS